jgi:hypothetical protein
VKGQTAKVRGGVGGLPIENPQIAVSIRLRMTCGKMGKSWSWGSDNHRYFQRDLLRRNACRGRAGLSLSDAMA